MTKTSEMKALLYIASDEITVHIISHELKNLMVYTIVEFNNKIVPTMMLHNVH